MKIYLFLLSLVLIPAILIAQNSPARSWLLRGNRGTDTSINFLGTTDARPLLFKVNNQRSGLLDLDSIAANAAFGYQALQLNTSINNTAMGYKALALNSFGQYNTANGAYALASNSFGLGNTGIGAQALFQNTSGSSNTGIGQDALYSTTFGSNNVAVGNQVLLQNTTGSSNSAFGSLAMYLNNGSENSAFGANVLYDNTTGNANAGFGEYALFINATGNNNTAIGDGALFGSSTGSNNTAVGLGALFQNSIGNNNTAVGYTTNVTEGDLNNTTAIGYNAVVDASNKVRLGNSDVSSIGGVVSWTNMLPDDSKMDIKENVPGLRFIRALRPVTYDLGILNERQPAKINPSFTEKMGKFLKPDARVAAAQGNARTSQVKITGLIASEVDSAAAKIDYDFSGIDKHGTTWGIRYGEFVVPLIKAVQELSKKNENEDKQIDSLEERNKILNDKLKYLFLKVEELERSVNKCCNCQPSHDGANDQKDARLEQNVPNPFSGTTTIPYYLPLNTGNASINFYSLNGTLIKSIPISSTGIGIVNLDTSDMPSGTIQYTLVNNNKIIDSKKMVQIK